MDMIHCLVIVLSHFATHVFRPVKPAYRMVFSRAGDAYAARPVSHLLRNGDVNMGPLAAAFKFYKTVH